MKSKQKGFFSIIIMLYILIILLSTTKVNEKFIDFGTITLAETQKNSKIYTFETIINNNLNNSIECPQTLKTKVNFSIISFFKENNMYVYDIIDKTKKEITLLDLEMMSQVVVIKPAKNILIKRYYVTNTINKNKYIMIEIETINYRTKYLFPENYYKEVIVYKK